MRGWLHDMVESIRVLGFWRTIYLTYIYRHLMQALHRFGVHHMKFVHPIGNQYWWKCDWCGMTSTTLHMDSPKHGLSALPWEEYENRQVREQQKAAFKRSA